MSPENIVRKLRELALTQRELADLTLSPANRVWHKKRAELAEAAVALIEDLQAELAALKRSLAPVEAGPLAGVEEED